MVLAASTPVQILPVLARKMGLSQRDALIYNGWFMNKHFDGLSMS